MRVLLVNKFFRSFGGPESLMFRQAEMLRAHGHEVAFLSMDHPDNLPSEWAPYFVSNVELSGGGKAGSLGGKLRTAGRILYSREARRKTLALVDRFKPDVAICHNIYHQLSPSVVSGLRARRVRTLLFLHDYKLVCPAYGLLAEDGRCERCVGGHFLNALRHRCVGGSRAESALCALECWLHRSLRLYARADLLVSPSRFLLSKVMADPVYARCATAHMPVALELTPPPAEYGADGPVLYVGVLTRVKGVEVLLEAAKRLPDRSFVIVGDGPDEERLHGLARELRLTNVTFTGRLTGEALAEVYRRAGCLAMPSILYENCPTVIIEAAMHGKPAVVSNIGGMAELTEDGVTGLHFAVGDADDLARRLSDLLGDATRRAALGRAAREKAEREWSLERHYELLMEAVAGP